jgi:energy-coupling factor transport system ATP-binding protein
LLDLLEKKMQVEVHALYFTYPGDIQALRGISLAIEQGEKVAIIGQNGSGKTTLVKHFNGLLQPAQGSVQIGDWDTKHHSVAELASRVGYVFQNPDEQLFNSDVKSELGFGPRNLGYDPARIAALVEDAIELTGLESYRHTNPYDLSPTWRKMVALASIITLDSPIVVFDEPTTGQDAQSVDRIARIVSELHSRGKTLITISHDIDFCAENFDRIIAMSEGKIILDGPVLEVIAQEEILATTFVDPPQLTRLGVELGLAQTVSDQASFLDAFRLARKHR